jgi:PAS domain S-box-containing protein
LLAGVCDVAAMEQLNDQDSYPIGEERRILEVLNRTGAALAAELDLERLVQIVTDAGVQIAGAAFGAFFYVNTDARGDKYMLYALSGVPREKFSRFPLPGKTKLFGTTFDGESIVRSDDITQDPRYGLSAPFHGMPPGHLEVRSYLAVPVVSRSQGVIGGLFFGHPTAGVFKDSTERTIAGLAAQAGIAFDNALLYRASQSSERRFRALLEHGADGIALIDAENKILYLSPAVTGIEGYTAEELTGGNGIDNTHPDDVPLVQAAVAQAVANPGQSVPVVWRRRHKDGRWLWLEGVATNLLDDPAVHGIVTNYRDVTHRIAAEQALRESEETFAAAFRSSPLPMAISDMDSRFVDVNAAFSAITGYSREEMLGTHVMQTATMSAADREKLIAEMQRNGGAAHNVEIKTYPRNAPPRDVLFSISTVTINGKPHRLSTALDITDRKLAEENVRRLNRTYSMLSEINQLIMRDFEQQSIIDNACRIAIEKGGFLLAWIGLNDQPPAKSQSKLRLAAHAGASPDTLAILHDILSSDSGCAFTTHALTNSEHSVCNNIATHPWSESWRDAALQRGYCSMAAFPLFLDGRHWGTFNLYASSAEFFDAGELELLNELAWDIAFALSGCERERAREHAQEALKRNEERFRVLIESASDLIAVLDAHGGIKYHSPSLKAVLGYEVDRVLGQRMHDYIHPDDFPAASTAIDHALQNPLLSVQLEYRVRHLDGTWRRLHSIARSLPDESPDGFVVVNSRDITERHQLEQQLAQSQKLQAIGTLAGGIAHDFNNILSAIVGNAEMARLDLGQQHPAMVSIKEIQRASQRAKELVQRILGFSRPQEQQLVPMHLQPVIEEAVRLLRSTMPASVELNVDCPADLPAVRADASQIHQVVLNLATNAWHAMIDNTGRVDIRLAACRVDSTLCQSHPELHPGPHVRLTVSDNGAGMNVATLARIFDPFFTTKPTGQGAGLGLSVVHGIMRAHAGAVVVESEPMRGATFHLYFPVCEAAVQPAAPPADQSIERGNGERLMFIDDEEPLVKLAIHFLTKQGYRVTGFTTPEHALAAFKAQPGNFDLVVTDFNMPGMSGVTVAEEMLRIRPNLLIALSSGYLRPQEIERARAAGIREILLKPNSLEELGPMVRRMLASHN